MRIGIVKSLSLTLLIAAGCGEEAVPSQSASTPEATETGVSGGDYVSVGLPDPSPTPGASFWYSELDVTPMLTGNDRNGVPVLTSLSNALADAAYVMQNNITAAQDHNENGDSMGRPDILGTTNVKVYDPSKAWDGYTLLTSLGYDFKPYASCTVYEDFALNPDCTNTRYGAILIDMKGNVVNEWPLSGFPHKLLPGGYVVGGNLSSALSPTFGLTMTSVQELDWCGNKVAEWFPAIESGFTDPGFHHDFQRYGSPVGYYAPGQCPDPNPADGTTLFLQNHVTTAPASFSGAFDLLDDGWYEMDANGNVLWSWHAMDHFASFGFDTPAQFAVANTRVGTGGPGFSDWTHENQLARLGPNRWYAMGDLRFHPDNLIFDFRSSSLLGIVARHDHPKGKWHAGDVVWRVGPNFGYGNPEYQIGQVIGPHNAHMIPAGLPGAGDIILFDNGGFSGFGSSLTGLPGIWPNKFRDYSRVVEFNPITLEVVWEYSFPTADPTTKTPKFYSSFISNIQRLPNGNTLIAQGGNGRVFEVTPRGTIVWEYISPFEGVLPFIPGNNVRPNAVYRAYRIPKSWIPPSLLGMKAGAGCTMPAGWTFPTTCR